MGCPVLHSEHANRKMLSLVGPAQTTSLPQIAETVNGHGRSDIVPVPPSFPGPHCPIWPAKPHFQKRLRCKRLESLLLVLPLYSFDCVRKAWETMQKTLERDSGSNASHGSVAIVALSRFWCFFLPSQRANPRLASRKGP